MGDSPYFDFIGDISLSQVGQFLKNPCFSLISAGNLLTFKVEIVMETGIWYFKKKYLPSSFSPVNNVI